MSTYRVPKCGRHFVKFSDVTIYPVPVVARTLYYQHIKPPINKAIGETFKRENANVLRWLLSSRLQDGGPDTYPQQNWARIHNNERTKLEQIMHTDKKQQQTVHIYTYLARKSDIRLDFCPASLLLSFFNDGNLHRLPKALIRCYVTSCWQWWVVPRQIVENNRVILSLLSISLNNYSGIFREKKLR